MNTAKKPTVWERIFNPHSARVSITLLLMISALNIFCCLTNDPAYWLFSLAFPYRLAARLAEGDATPLLTALCIFCALLFLAAFVLLWHFVKKYRFCFLIAAALLALDMLVLFITPSPWGLLDVLVHLLIVAEFCLTYFFCRQKEDGEEFIAVEPPEKAE